MSVASPSPHRNLGSIVPALMTGRDGQLMTPEQIAREREIAAALIAKGSATAPIQHWTQGVAQLVDAWSGGMRERRANEAEKANREEGRQIESAIYGALFPSGGVSAGTGAGASASGGLNLLGSPAVVGSTVAASDLKPYQAALLDTISGPESAGRYDVMYGGGRFSDFSQHPGKAIPIESGPNAGKTSSAAGRYQFLGSTWNQYANMMGLSDFSPANQDRAAWQLAADTYRANTGQDLDAVLQSGDPEAIAGVGGALSKVWTSLPGGIEQGTNTNRFVSAFNSGFGRYAGASQPEAAPMQAAQQPAPVQVASLDPAAGMGAPASFANRRRDMISQALDTVQGGAAASAPASVGGNVLSAPGTMSPEDQAIYDQRIRGQGAQPNPVPWNGGPGAQIGNPSEMRSAALAPAPASASARSSNKAIIDALASPRRHRAHGRQVRRQHGGRDLRARDHEGGRLSVLRSPEQGGAGGGWFHA